MDTNKGRVSDVNNAWEQFEIKQFPNGYDETCKQREERFSTRAVDEAIEQCDKPFSARVVDETIMERDLRLGNKAIGTKHDQGKPRWSLLPWWQLGEVIEVLEIGAANHGVDNWHHVDPNRFKEALLRHVAAFAKGEYLDKDSGKSHLAHIVTNALFLMWHIS
jgi:Domain of unknown function (DUF5664)